MLNRKLIALSLAALALSTSAVLAAPRHPVVRGESARSAYAAVPAAGAFDRGGVHYYAHDDNGTVWSFYPGYVPSSRN